MTNAAIGMDIATFTGLFPIMVVIAAGAWGAWKTR